MALRNRELHARNDDDCYARRTEYKKCACVCVSVTLSVNSFTGQTPQRIFTVDSLKDADLRKDVPFGGLDDECI